MNYHEILQQAELGNAEAQAEIGYCHFWGHKVEEINYEEAIKWFKLSADQGCAYGQYWMQRCLREGLGIEPNRFQENDYAKKAFQWFSKEADQENPKVQLYLGYCYEGPMHNPKAAFECYMKAAQHGLADAEYCLAICYAQGFGTEQNGNEYVAWTRKAAEHGNSPSQFNWGSILLSGYENDGTPNYEEAVIWLKKSAEQGHVGAQLALAKLYESGNGVEQSEQEANFWYQKAAMRGNFEAQEKVCSAEELFNMSVEYLNTDDERYHNAAYQYCLAAYHKGDGDGARLNLALMHLRGVAPVWDGILASNLLSEAVQKGNKDAKNELDNLTQGINSYSSNAKTNPILCSTEVPIFNGIEKSLQKFAGIDTEGVQGALCGRIGSICDYPMVELKKSKEFQSVSGDTLDNPTDGICLHMTFIQSTKNATDVNVEEAFYYNLFKQLDIYGEFTCFVSDNVSNAEPRVANIWEFVVDCGHDINKAKRIASSLIYHLYGYKNNSFLYPEIFLHVQPSNVPIITPQTQSSKGMLSFNLEQFGVLDAIVLVIAFVVSFFFMDGGIIGFLLFALFYFYYGAFLLSRFKKLKFPKRNYIHFFRNPNQQFEN